jgi:hypothetical protein
MNTNLNDRKHFYKPPVFCYVHSIRACNEITMWVTNIMYVHSTPSTRLRNTLLVMINQDTNFDFSITIVCTLRVVLVPVYIRLFPPNKPYDQ